MRKFRMFALTATLLAAIAGVSPGPATADDSQDARQLVERARLTFESFTVDRQMGESLRSLVKKAKAVMIYPQVFRGAFILGGSGGSGVVLAREATSGNWSEPAFYTIGQASFGLQAGADVSEVVLVALTERGLTSLLNTSAKLGGNASVAIGPIGMGAEAATANLSADLISFTRNKGLYAGISLDGAVVATRGGLNEAYYGRPVTPTDILVMHTVTNPQSAGLVTAVAKVAGGAPAVFRIVPGPEVSGLVTDVPLPSCCPSGEGTAGSPTGTAPE